MNSSTSTAAESTTLTLHDALPILTAGSSLTGDGTVSVAAGSASTTAGGVNWAGGTLNVLGAYDVADTNISSGTINFINDATTTDLRLSSDYNDGVLGGSGILTVTD